MSIEVSQEWYDNHVKALAQVTRERDDAKAEIARLTMALSWAENDDPVLVEAIRDRAALKPDTGKTLYVPLESYVQFTDGTFVTGEEADKVLLPGCPLCGYRHPPDGVCV